MAPKWCHTAYRVAANRLPLIEHIRDDLRRYGRVHLRLRSRAASTLFVPIIGMHRSGTSAVASLLQANGLSLGTDLIDANETNEPGFFESRSILGINNAFLHRLGGSWRHPPAQVPQFPGSLFRQVKRVLNELSSFGSVVGWKDPRTTITWPAWHELLYRQPFQIIAVFRHPNRVAKSLLAIWEDLSRPEAMDLWLSYNRRLLALEHDVLWINFDAPLEQQIRLGCGRLNLRFDPASMAIYNQRLVHNCSDGESTGSSDADYAYEWLLAKWKQQMCAVGAENARTCDSEHSSVGCGQ